MRFRTKRPFFKYLPSADFKWHNTDYQWQIAPENKPFCRVECRNFSHLNPVKRHLAISIPFRRQNMGEDCEWAQAMRKKYPNMKDEAVQHVCYHYCNNTAHSIAHDPLQNKPRIRSYCDRVMLIINKFLDIFREKQQEETGEQGNNQKITPQRERPNDS